jgi:L-arabinose transport system permease protein
VSDVPLQSATSNNEGPAYSKRPALSGYARNAWEQAGMLLVLVLVFATCSAIVPNFLSWTNMNGLALSVSTIGMISCTMLFCLASGDFDLSVGSVVACAGVLAAVVSNQTGSVIVGMLAGILGGGLVGLVNGVVVAQLRINALIATLATMQIVRGFSFMISSGKAVGVAHESFYMLGNWSFRGVTAPVWYALAAFLFFGVLLRSTIFGRNTLAIGGNREAARLAGIHVERTKIIIFTMQGLMAAFAGVVLASRMTSGQPGASQGLELEVISACVLGGVSLAGGVGSMLFVISGVLIMGIVQNAMNLANVPTFYQYVARGSILLIAVILDRLKTQTSLTQS